MTGRAAAIGGSFSAASSISSPIGSDSATDTDPSPRRFVITPRITASASG